jgi:SAM-dependent methyltransferase
MKPNKSPGLYETNIEAARLYDAHHSRHIEDLDFWLGLAAEQEDPILELGCGSGRVLIPMAQAGYRVFGLDRDAAMLGVLRANLPPAVSSNVSIFQANLTAFWVSERFNLILLACNTYSTLSATDRASCLNVARKHLRPAGAFAASLPNPLLLSSLPERSAAEVEETFLDPHTGDPIQVSSSWERDQGHFNLFWHYDRLFPNGDVQRLTIKTRHELNPAQTYVQELQEAGFVSIETYGDFDRSEYDPSSPALILKATAPSLP